MIILNKRLTIADLNAEAQEKGNFGKFDTLFSCFA